MLFIGLAEWLVVISALPEEQGLHHDLTTEDQHSDGTTKQPPLKTTWIPESGILQIIRCTSNLNPRQ
jgi:hypothetical protein